MNDPKHVQVQPNPDVKDEAGVPASEQTGVLEAARIAAITKANAPAKDESAEHAAEAKRKHDAEVAFDAQKAKDKAAGHETLAEHVDDVKEAVEKKVRRK